MVILNLFRKITSFNLKIIRLETNPNDEFLTKTKISEMILESILIMMCPLPFLSQQYFCPMNPNIDQEACYSYNDILHIAQLYKLFFIIKAFSITSEFANPSSYRACAIYRVENNITFVFRCVMQEHPFQLIMTLMLAGIFVFGYALQISETPVSLKDKTIDLKGYFECCWCIMITMSTVGFGDYFPRSTFGRFTIFFATIYGMIVTSLMVNFISDRLNLSQPELKAFTVVNRIEIMKNIKKKASHMIYKMGRYFVLKKKRTDVQERTKILKDLIDESSNLRGAKSEYQVIQDNNLEEDAERSFALVALEIEEMAQLMKQLKESFKKYKTKKENPK